MNLVQTRAHLRNAAERLLPPSWFELLRTSLGAGVAPKTMHHLARMRDQGFDPKVVIDVGAAHGHWTASCRRIFPSAKFVLIEPLTEYAAELSALSSFEGIDYVPVAAGRVEADLPLLIPNDLGGSSFLPSSRLDDPYFKRSVIVPVVPLDSLDLPGGATLMKLDVQGFELEVLEGATATLDEVEVVVVECSLHPFQRDLPLIDDVIAWFTAHGFRLFDTADEKRWHSGTLAQVDLIFVRSGDPLLAPRWWK